MQKNNDFKVRYSTLTLIKAPSTGGTLYKFWDGDKYFFAEIEDRYLFFAFKSMGINKYFFKFHAEIREYQDNRVVIYKTIRKQKNKNLSKNLPSTYFNWFNFDLYLIIMLAVFIIILLIFK